MMHTLTDEQNRLYLILPVSGKLDVSDPHSPDEARWCVHVSDPASPLAGLTAYGDTLAAARDNLAALAWTVAAGEPADSGVETSDVAGIHVLLTTSAKYDVRALAVAAEGAA